MAATSGAAPGGFSYAQAARGQQSKSNTQSTTEAPSTDSTRDWAEDAEAASTKSKATGAGISAQDSSLSAQDAKTSVPDRSVLDGKAALQSSGISSPDIAASATSHDDTSSSAPNGSSLSSWEAKSQSSETVVPTEPSWIAEREKRQGTNKSEVPNGKPNNTTIMPEQKPVVLHDAAPPAVNPWARRADEAKAKITAQPPAAPKPTPSANEPTRTAQQIQEHKPTWNKPAPIVQPAKEARAVESAPKGHRATKSAIIAQPPSVKDQTSWPTPEVKQEVERKPTAPHSQEERLDDEASSGKPRKKQEWKPVPVVPNIIWETPGIHPRASRSSPNGERAPRGGANVRGRGGARGASNSVAHGDRASTQNTEAGSTNGSAREQSSSRELEQDGKQSKPARKAGLVNGTRDASIPEEKQNQPTPDSQRSSSKAPTEPETKLNTNITTAAAATAAAAGGATPAVNGAEVHSETTTPIEARKDGGAREFQPSTRGSARRGRGRGGRGDLTNGHTYNYVPQEYPGQYAHSPTFPRGGYNNAGRAGFRANGNRAQSLPFDPAMLRYPPYMMPQQYSPMQPYSPMSEYGMFGMPPPQVYFDYPLANTVTNQLDYYFSIDNLLKDTFLRKNMDSQGFVLLETIAAFNRLKQLTTDLNLIKTASSASESVEIVVGDDGKERLRKIKDWEQWVLPMEERFPAACTPGPQSFEHLHNPIQAQMPPRHHMSLPYINAPRPGDRRSYDFSYGQGHQMSPHAMFSPEHQGATFNKDFVNGTDESRGRNVKATPYTNGTSSNNQSPNSPTANQDADVFPDDKIEQLTVCVMLGKDSAPQYNSSSRTFSNGSIDASVVEDGPKTGEANGDKAPAVANGQSSGPSYASAEAQDLSVFWIKDNDSPTSSLPSNLTPEPYLRLREKAVSQRNAASTGNCPYDMEVLYQFWSHFLIRNFNNSMYGEFVRLAQDDNDTRYSPVGHRNLAKYYDHAINNANLIPLRVAKDYVAMAKTESSSNKEGSAVFKNLHRAWRDGALNLRNRKRVSDILDTELRQHLEA